MLLMEWKMTAALICLRRPSGHIIQANSLKTASCLIWKETRWNVHGEKDLTDVKMHTQGSTPPKT